MISISPVVGQLGPLVQNALLRVRRQNTRRVEEHVRPCSAAGGHVCCVEEDKALVEGVLTLYTNTLASPGDNGCCIDRHDGTVVRSYICEARGLL